VRENRQAVFLHICEWLSVLDGNINLISVCSGPSRRINRNVDSRVEVAMPLRDGAAVQDDAPVVDHPMEGTSRIDKALSNDASPTQHPTNHITPVSPPINILPSVLINPTSSSASGSGHKPSNDVHHKPEAPAIEALILAQRARTPIAIAVAQDYSAVPFKVPRPFVVLGWFWVLDAWVSASSISCSVRKLTMNKARICPR
jgi:hypothetical protein